uniref:Uncharacterized protein n=1 Tax=Zea mays TaxID=4577 RepID=C4J816_MAIZE|nr:unknown [Zea mays]
MQQHLEFAAPLRELAYVLGSHDICVESHIVSFVEIRSCSSVYNDVYFLAHLSQFGSA